MFPNLTNSEKKAIGMVITKGDDDFESIDYIDLMIKNGYKENVMKWLYYFKDHQEQFFMMPKASRHMEGKSFDFKDKHKIIDFIKRDL